MIKIRHKHNMQYGGALLIGIGFAVMQSWGHYGALGEVLFTAGLLLLGDARWKK